MQARGRSVAIVDRHAQAGEETSFGNAGLIERSSIFPYVFPRDPVRLDRLTTDYATMEKALRGGGPQEGWWAGFQRELGSIVSIHRADTVIVMSFDAT